VQPVRAVQAVVVARRVGADVDQQRAVPDGGRRDEVVELVDARAQPPEAGQPGDVGQREQHDRARHRRDGGHDVVERIGRALPAALQHVVAAAEQRDQVRLQFDGEWDLLVPDLVEPPAPHRQVRVLEPG
jgi:hypothetical protein